MLWVDKNNHSLSNERIVDAPEKIKEIVFDYILIAVQSPALAKEIKAELVLEGIDSKKIMWVGTNIQTFRR